MNPKALQKLSYGVYLLTTWDHGRATGCVVNSIMQITSSPETVAASVNNDNFTKLCIDQTGKFAVSILSEASDPDLIRTFGFQSGKDVDKFADVPYRLASYYPVVEDACGYLVCEVMDSLDCATHTVFLAKVVESDTLRPERPMTYAYYHEVIKGKSPKNAPTYVAEDVKTGTYVCTICGHVYDGEIPFESLPEDWVCPVCKQPKSKFVKQV